jgi:putative tryptophan/tyrosine transport system substrate-binding protein
MIRRREFITLFGGAAVAWPLAARAQQTTKRMTIGFLGAATPSAWRPWVAALVQRLQELGWIEGRTVRIEYRWAEGREERYAEISDEFVRLRVDLIVTSGAAVAAAKQATSAIPIVFGVANDPVSTGLVTSLAHPGGNVTGLSLLAPELAGKRLELLRDVIPNLRRLAIMGNVDYPASVLEMHEAQTTALTLGLEVATLEIKQAADIVASIEELSSRADALYVCADPLLLANALRINTLALGSRLPTMHALRDFVDASGLMSYGPDIRDLWRRAADYVDKIFRGARPGDIPVEQPVKFDLVVNRIVARALRLEIPPTFLARADEVIE